MTKIIGLTGGIGSGKTTAARFFEKHGIPVYVADERARIVMQRAPIISQVQSLFKQNVIEPDGQLNRKLISQLVFDNPIQLEKLNAIIHPIVQEDFKQWLHQHSQFPFIIKEVAILFETKGHLQCDATILIQAPVENRILRVMKRDAKTKSEVLQIIQNQMPEEEKEKLATYSVKNNDLNSFNYELENILKKLINRYNLT